MERSEGESAERFREGEAPSVYSVMTGERAELSVSVGDVCAVEGGGCEEGETEVAGMVSGSESGRRLRRRTMGDSDQSEEHARFLQWEGRECVLSVGKVLVVEATGDWWESREAVSNAGV